MTAAGAGVAVRRLSKTFPPAQGFTDLLRRPAAAKPVEALCDVSFEVATGEIFGLLGPNGAGKTTLVEVLATLLLPTSGTAAVAGHDVVVEADAARVSLGYCPADSETLYPRLSGEENLYFFAMLQGLSRDLARARIRELLQVVDLVEAGPVRVERFSDGMKSRLSLARALLTDPAVLLLDEPTRALDPLRQVAFRRFARDTLVDRLGKTILWVTHSVAEAEELCARVAILHEGRLVAAGTPAEVRAVAGARDLATAFVRSVTES